MEGLRHSLRLAMAVRHVSLSDYVAHIRISRGVCGDYCCISHSRMCCMHCIILDFHIVGKANDGSGLDGSWGSASCSHTGEDELQNPGSPTPAPAPCNGRQIQESSADYRRRCGTGGFRHPPPPPAPPPPIGTWWQVRFSAIYSRVQGGTGQDRTLASSIPVFSIRL